MEDIEKLAQRRDDSMRARLPDLPSDRLITSFRVWLEARDVMSREVVDIRPDDTVLTAAKLMSKNKVSCVVVVDEGSPVGILTETDILMRVASKQKDFHNLPVAEVMSSPLVSIPHDLSVLEAGKLMEQKRIKRLPILREKRLVGIVTQTDLVRALTSYDMFRDVTEIMSQEVAGIPSDATVDEAADLMTSRNISCIVVLEEGEAAGILTERDLLTRVVAPQRDPTRVRLYEVMSSPVISVPHNYSVFSTSKIMETANVRRLVVTRNKRLCGLVAQTDIFRTVKRKLQEDEEQNLKLLEKSENAIYTNDLEGNTTYVNTAFAKLFAVASPREFVEQPFLPERFWCDPQQRLQLLAELRKGTVGTKELALKTAEGKRIYVTLFSIFTKNCRGEINGSQGVLYDITEKKELVALRKAEEALRESERKFRSIAESSFDVIYTADPQGRITYVSPAVERLLGYRPEEVIGKHFKQFFPKSHLSQATQAHLDVFNGGGIQGLQLQVCKRDGSEAVVEISSAPIRREGEVIESQGVVRDITQRKRMEEQLRESEKKLRTIFQNATDVITYIDSHGKILNVNKRVEELLGHKREEVLGKNFTALGVLGVNDLPKVLRLFQNTVRDGEAVRLVEVELKAKNGTKVVVEVGTRFIKENGKVKEIVSIFRDITQRKQAMIELANAKRAAEEASRSKSEFLANVSHEIRTPMTAVLGYTDLLTDPNLPSGERESHLRTIRRNGEILLDLINDILDVSKIEAGKMPLERRDCSVWQIVEDAVALMRIRAGEKDLGLNVEYAFPLPQTIRTDPVRLRQILVNLIGNAVKFTEQGEVRLVVSCTSQPDTGPRVDFAVVDTGIGIAPELGSRLFEPFFQGDASTTRRYAGTGLGLTISKRLAEMLGGDVTLQSEPGKGSTFTVTIDPGPLDDVPMLDSPPKTPVEEEPHAEPLKAGTLRGRVLLAEDGIDNQRLIRLLLEKAGLEVDVAEDGRVAYEKASASRSQRRPYDLILMDMQMPEVDGYEVTRRLRQDGWRGPIIALTAYAMTGDREKCLEVGCDDYASKPIDRAGLLAMIARHLGVVTPA